MQAKLISTDGTKRTVTINSFVGARNIICQQGYMSPIEIINLGEAGMILIDEEGKLKNLPHNPEATAIAHENEAIYPNDYVCGDVILVENANEFDDLPYE